MYTYIYIYATPLSRYCVPLLPCVYATFLSPPIQHHHTLSFSNSLNSLKTHARSLSLSLSLSLHPSLSLPLSLVLLLFVENSVPHEHLGLCRGCERQVQGCHVCRMCYIVCCSVLQCVAVCCSVLQCVAVCCSVL